MNNKFLYAKSISLENILKLLFKKPEIERNTKLNLLLQFEIIEHINQQTFDEYFFYNFNYFNRCISFNLSNDERLALAFIYNKEKQKFEMAISTNKDIKNRKEELFDKLSDELQNSKYYYLYKTNGYYVSDCERIKVLQYLKDMAEMEYNDGFMVFYPELIDIQALIIETFESNCINGNSSELFSNLCKEFYKMETSNIEKNIVGVIDALLKSAETEDKEFLNSNKDIIQKFEELRQQYKSNYTFIESLRFSLISKITKLICITLDIPLSDDNLMIIENLFKGTYEHFFEHYIHKTEGSAFSCDKSYYILGRIIASMIHNKNISLYETYRKHPSIKNHAWGKQTYWSPETIKDTNEAFKLFNNWYYFKSN